MRGVSEINCAVCGGTGRIQTITTADVMRAGKEILEETAVKYRLSIEAMVGPSRHKTLVAARREAAERMRDETSLTLKAIGLLIGRRDHSTIVNLLR